MNWDSIVEDLGPRLYKYFCVRFTKEQADELNTEQTIISFQSAAKIRELIQELSKIEQQILLLFIDEELAINEIGLILQMPEGTIKSHIPFIKFKHPAFHHQLR